MSPAYPDSSERERWENIVGVDRTINTRELRRVRAARPLSPPTGSLGLPGGDVAPFEHIAEDGAVTANQLLTYY